MKESPLFFLNGFLKAVSLASVKHFKRHEEISQLKMFNPN